MTRKSFNYFLLHCHWCGGVNQATVIGLVANIGLVLGVVKLSAVSESFVLVLPEGE